MPTAGEYKHAPFGIPCRCYEKRRENRPVNTVERKSCIRNLNSQFTSTKHKKVTFDSVLRVRLYEKNQSVKFEVSERILVDELQPSVAGDVPNDSKNQSVEPNTQTDLNNNRISIANEPVDMSGDACSVRSLASTTSDKTGSRSASYVSRSFNKVFYSESGTTQPSECDECLSICEHGDCSLPESHDTLPAQCTSNGICKSDSIPGCEPTMYPFSAGGCSICDPFVSLESHDLKASTLPAYVSYSPMSTFVDPKRANTPAPPLRPAKKHEHSDEYIYATPDAHDNDYEYVPIRSALRRRTESENHNSSLTVAAFENADYKSCRAAGDVSAEPANAAVAITQLSTVMQQSAPDLPAIVTSPYDIKFLNECVRAYKRQSQWYDGKVLGTSMSNEPRVRMSEKCQSFGSDRKGSVGWCAFLRELVQMTPIALFWTGCAFLIAVVYIFVFTCTHNE